eukprot:jgi/Phyca11/100224/e_gw1.4.271.1
MCVGYPAFQVLFNHASQTNYELPVLLLLPVLKILMKRLLAHQASHKWDIAATEIIVTVDFFDALYLATFIPNLKLVSLVAVVRLREAADIPDRADNLSLLAAPQVDDIASGSSRKLRSSVVDNSGALQEALEVLFTSEILILTEYLEVIVPLVYGTFILAMVHLPSAQYHTEMAGVTLENVHSTVSRMFIYTLLELFSFLLLVGIMKRNCCIDAVYQLAFVLKTHSHVILSKLILWMVLTLAYRVAHFGMSVRLILL